jgi:hypothetical protein
MNGNPYEGWNLHSLRKTGSQQLDSPRVREYLIARNFSHPQAWLSEAIQTHKNLEGTNAVSATYKASPDVLDRVVAMAIEVLSELMYGDLGARMVVDVERYATALRLSRALDAQTRDEKERRDELTKSRRAKRATAKSYQVDMDEINAKLVDLAEQRIETRTLIERIENGDRSLMIPLPDDVDDDEIMVDLEQVRNRVLGLSHGQPAGTARETVRSWITVSELADVAGVSRRTAGSWTQTNGSWVVPPGTPPFLTSRSPALDLSATRRVIPVLAFNPKWLDEDPNRRVVLHQVLCDWPAADTWLVHRSRDHALPEWLADELADAHTVSDHRV